MEYKTRAEVPNEYKWDLNKMYKSMDEIEEDINEVESLCKASQNMALNNT